MTSKIKVDNINKVSDDTNIIKKCGSTTTVGSGSGNTIVVCGATVTIGRCGGTVALASGATQTGFGRTGTVDWDTTPKTATFTAVSGDGFFANTESGAFTMNLPAGSAGAIVSVADYAGTWQTHALTVSPNGSDKIGGVSADVDLNTEGQSVTFIFVDSTQGWVNTMDSTSNVRANAFVAATGGTTVTCGNFKTHIFTGPGTFCVSSAGAPSGSNTVDYMVVAGGSGGGKAASGGAGAGGFRLAVSTTPQSNPLNGSALPISATSYSIAVGAGGSGGSPGCSSSDVTKGAVSTFSSITSAAGGAGGGPCGTTGGSGAGGGSCATGSAGNTPPTTPPQGNNGGNGRPQSYPTGGAGGGGGGAGAVGTTSVTGSGNPGGPGGIGSNLPDAFIGPTAPSYGTPGPVGSTRYFAGGGGGGSYVSAGTSTGGTGGGGNGSGSPGPSATNATANTGGGGGGGFHPGGLNGAGSNGGSGIVMIRYKFQ
jgi:hypothetical protein